MKSDNINMSDEKFNLMNNCKPKNSEVMESFLSDVSSEFSFTDASEQGENQNSSKVSIIQQLICLKQRNKELRESNPKLETVVSTAMSNYTDAINQINN